MTVDKGIFEESVVSPTHRPSSRISSDGFPWPSVTEGDEMTYGSCLPMDEINFPLSSASLSDDDLSVYCDKEDDRMTLQHLEVKTYV